MATTPGVFGISSTVGPYDLRRSEWLLDATWKNQVRMMTSFATDIQMAQSGKEARMALRGTPIREISYTTAALPTTGNFRSRTMALRNRESSHFVPLVMDCMVLATAVPASPSAPVAIPMDTTNLRLEVGQWVSISKPAGAGGPRVHQERAITAVASNSVTVSILSPAVVVGDMLVPLMVCQLSEAASGTAPFAVAG